MPPLNGASRSIDAWLGRRARTVTVVGGALLAAIMIFDLAKVAADWREAIGNEYAWIAESITEGHGFSFRGNHRHLFNQANSPNEADPSRYYPTAWEEPVSPYLLGTYLYGRSVSMVDGWR